MAKKVAGLTVLLLGLVGLFFAISALCLKTSLGASETAHDAELGVAVNEIRIEAVQLTIQRVQNAQDARDREVQRKLNVLIERGQ